MKTQKRVLSVVVAFLFVMSMFVGCGNNDTATKTTSTGVVARSTTSAAEEQVYAENGLPKDQNVTLKLGYFEGGMGREYYDIILDKFLKKYPNVKIDTTYSPKMYEQITKMAAANDDANMFDLFACTGLNQVELMKNNKLESLKDVFDKKLPDSDKSLKEMMDDGLYIAATNSEKNFFNVPFCKYILGFYYDKKFFADNNWNTVPKTWDEFLKLCEGIKAKGIVPIVYTGVYSNYIENSFTMPKMFEIAERNGNKTFEDNFRNLKTPYYSSPESIETLNKLYELGSKGYFANGLVALNHTQSQMMIIQNKAALVATGSWVQTEMKDATPADFQWGYMEVPTGNNQNDPIYANTLVGENFAVWAAKPDLNKKWAKEFILNMLTLESQQTVVEKTGMPYARKDMAEHPDMLANAPSIVKSISDYQKSVNYKTMAAFNNFVPTHENYNKAIAEYRKDLILITENKKKPEEIMPQVDEILSVAVDEYNKTVK